jgi:hypothetical protein
MAKKKITWKDISPKKKLVFKDIVVKPPKIKWKNIKKSGGKIMQGYKAGGKV